MTIYWLLLLVPALAGLSPWKAKGTLPQVQWFLYGLFLLLIIGFRHEVGGDWSVYIENYREFQGMSIFDLFSPESLSRDIGYAFIHWVSLNYLNGIYSTNLFCSGIFIAGLLRVCKNMPIPWLALAVAIPYLVIVVAMGYTRQAAAIGLIMWGLVDLMNGKTLRFYVLVILGVLFHKTALFILPVGFLYGHSIRNLKDFLLFILLFIITFVAFLMDRIEGLVTSYVTDTTMESSGAFIRVMMNIVSALVFLYFRKAWVKQYNDERLWVIFSVVSLIMLPLTFVLSTTVDRMALYFLPMQLVILSRVPLLIINRYQKTLFVLCVLFLYSGVLFVWLNFGANSSAWLPYQNYLFN